jgi:dTDP-glucose 4,6-dehydratase
MILVTGGAGFIGANFVLDWLAASDEPIVNLDRLTYAGNRQSLASLSRRRPPHLRARRHRRRRTVLNRLLAQYAAAGDHQLRCRVTRGPLDPRPRRLHPDQRRRHLPVARERPRAYWKLLPEDAQRSFRFLHVSTDEVYGSLAPDAPAFTEDHPYQPNSPYSASKAASDHLLRAYHHTYGLPVLTTNCSNNYGPYQFPEKLIPLMIVNALAGKPLPVYGDGQQIRDWLYVGDHCAAIRRVLAAGVPGATYNVGGGNEKANLEIVHTVCGLLDDLRPRPDGRPYRQQITYVTDRPGHDRRYAIDARRIERDLGWKPAETFASGIDRTVRWYLANQDWVHNVQSGAYRDWVEKNYAERQG